MFLNKFGLFLERIDHYRDELLFIFIKPYWPRKITPNQITYFRIIVGVGLVVMLFFLGIKNKVLIVSLFSIAAISDLFDGSVARGLGKVTEFGTMIDPIADRILVLPIAVYSLYLNHRWLLLILFLAEVSGSLISMYHKSRDPSVMANIFGKTKMALWSVVFVIILIFWPKEPPIFAIDMLWISLIFLFLSIFSRLLELKQKGFLKKHA